MTKRPSPETLARFTAIVGEKGVLRDPIEQRPYLEEWRNLWHGKTPLILRPASTEEISRIMALAFETETAIVPQSGNTGLVGGQIPDPDGSEVVLSLDRMTRIIAVDAEDFSITVEAGATLASVQAAALEHDRLYPLSLASEGSCRIGGNLGSNAGGVNVIAYGNARDLCLGLEVVLADGRVLNQLRALRKDNTGYDLRNIFIGSEGTLGIISKAVLKLFPRPRRHDTAFIAVPSPDAAITLLSRFRQRANNSVVAFELIPEIAIAFVTRHMGVRSPLPQASPWFVLAEFADAAETAMEAALAEAIEEGLASDAAVAQNETQRLAFWELREKLSDSQKYEGGSIKHDVSVPVSRIPAFIAAAIPAVEHFMPGCRFMCFGHVGDGNLHFNVSQPVGMDKQAYLDRWPEMSRIVHDVVLAHGGSISAEHGIGQLKREDMRRIKSATELDLMRGLKRMLDPKGILNPGKVLPDP
ncbi:MAG: FAD-binding oxidoreductase [Rhizobiales bacterium]|nr:FAD-binding oxidoreductase [Hyphomicrobiales bacterium]